jgi:L-lactate dehydrogenase
VIPLTEFPLPEGTSLTQIQAELVQVTRDRGEAILSRKGHTSYGVGTVVAQLIDAILRDEKRMFTVSTRADPTYGVGSEVVLGLPCIIGRHGIESRLVLPRNEVQQAQLQASATKLENAYQTAFGKGNPCHPDFQTIA